MGSVDAGSIGPFLLALFAGIAAILSLALLFFAAWILLRIVRWIVSGASLALGGGPRAAVVGAALVVTAVFVPAPFIHIAEFAVGVVRFVALDVPGALFRATQDLGKACAGAGDKCAETAIGALSALWGGPLKSLLQGLALPQSTLLALLVFSFAFAAMWVGHQRLAARVTPAPASAIHGGVSAAYKAVALALSLAGALYLSITAIIAIPIFNDRLGNLDETKRIFSDQAVKAREERKKQITFSSDDVFLPLPDHQLLRKEASALWQPLVDMQTSGNRSASENEGTGSDQTSGAAGTAASGGGSGHRAMSEDEDERAKLYRKVFLSIVDDYAEQAGAIGKARVDFGREIANFDTYANGMATTMGNYFAQHNTARVGGDQTRQHAAVLASSFDLWLAEYVKRVHACRSGLGNASQQAKARRDAIAVQVTLASQSRPQDVKIDEVVRSLTRAPTAEAGLADRSGVPRGCSELLPDKEDYLSPRRGPAEALGIFGYAAGWLLSTESVELALIVGLLGFGFFGAISTSFIREFASTAGNTLPPSGWIVPALIRGIAAAMLVFLVVVGGIAVFAQSNPQPKPNAYAVFLACFIAAVFSEDVWEWARRRQSEQFRATANRGSGGSTAVVQAAEVPPPAARVGGAPQP